MMGRIWHGLTKPENANHYEQLLKEEIFPQIADKMVPGYRGIQLFRRPIDDQEVEFVKIMWFDSLEAVIAALMLVFLPSANNYFRRASSAAGTQGSSTVVQIRI